MSNLTVKGNTSGTGTVILEAPNTNSNRTITLPDAATTLVGTDATQTLTNKTIDASQLTGDVAYARIAAAITPFTSAETTLSRDGRWTFAHGLGVAPSRVQMNLRCISANLNFSTNDVLYYYPGNYDVNSGHGVQISADATNVYLGVYYVYARNKTTGTTSTAWAEITYASWGARVLAWK